MKTGKATELSYLASKVVKKKEKEEIEAEIIKDLVNQIIVEGFIPAD